MTQEEKDILMEKMLDPEGVLTDAELERVFQDDELKEIYEVSSAVRGACVQPSKIDVKQEWRLFRHSILPKPSLWRWAMRVAAVFLGILFVSAIAKIAIDRILTEEKQVIVAKSESLTAEKHEQEISNPKPLQEVGNDGFATPPVHAVRKAVALRRNVAHRAVEEEEEIDVDEYLRLQQARIDNDMALIQAELYIAELQALQEAQSPAGEEEIELNEERYVIMQ